MLTELGNKKKDKQRRCDTDRESERKKTGRRHTDGWNNGKMRARQTDGRMDRVKRMKAKMERRIVSE